MRGWEAFINDDARCTDVLLKAAIASFGFVYLHPFLDGNGRLHRFLIHHVLARSGLMASGTLVPVSAVIEKNIPDYLDVLNSFSQPTARLWSYLRTDIDPMDLPQKDLSTLIRMIQSEQGRLSLRRRKQYSHLPERILDRIESVVREAFESPSSGGHTTRN